MGETENLLAPDRNLIVILTSSLVTLLLPDKLFNAVTHRLKQQVPFLLNLCKASVKVTSLYKVRTKLSDSNHGIQYGGRLLVCLLSLFWSSILIRQFSPAQPVTKHHNPPYKITSCILAAVVTVFLHGQQSEFVSILNFFILLAGFSFNKE
jgi:hypothetical protein